MLPYSESMQLLRVFSIHLHWLREIIPVCLVFVYATNYLNLKIHLLIHLKLYLYYYSDTYFLYRYVIVFPLKLHYFFTIFHYFIVFASELSNARISGFANTFARSSGSTSSATVVLLFFLLYMHLWIQILFLIKCFFKKLCIFPSVIIQNMRVHIRNHIDLSMAGITLYRFDVPTIQFQLISNTTMTETVKYNRWEIIVLDQFFLKDHGLLHLREEAQRYLP